MMVGLVSLCFRSRMTLPFLGDILCIAAFLRAMRLALREIIPPDLGFDTRKDRLESWKTLKGVKRDHGLAVCPFSMLPQESHQ